MSTPLTIDGDIFNYPVNRQSPGWGEEATAWATAVTDTLNSLNSTGDILTSTATISNNSSGIVNGLIFSTTTVRSAIVEFSVYRKTDDTSQEKCEVGILYLTYKSQAASFDLAQTGGGSSGVTFTINNSTGQLSYTSTNLTGANYSGTLKFRAKAFSQ